MRKPTTETPRHGERAATKTLTQRKRGRRGQREEKSKIVMEIKTENQKPKPTARKSRRAAGKNATTKLSADFREALDTFVREHPELLRRLAQ